MSGGTFFFSKAGQADFHYKNLSGGEKAAFDLILDLAIKAATYDDTVLIIDEPELHLNPRLQASLLQELLNLTSPDGQLLGRHPLDRNDAQGAGVMGGQTRGSRYS